MLYKRINFMRLKHRAFTNKLPLSPIFSSTCRRSVSIYATGKKANDWDPREVTSISKINEHIIPAIRMFARTEPLSVLPGAIFSWLTIVYLLIGQVVTN